ncbi:TolC family protein [Dehalobacterium formicoaceticum]|uniref:TolC family protein n=1 Tax=Dehalobacterium formicoaceticum TaxID=51515 RepID=A0ABT1Y3E8_9FIRM|nr:TolC family protein [Dehalobacterium formicoaceticum]MCR6545405.1 TolC family protein [Dehalobacterium formicoaceticum]
MKKNWLWVMIIVLVLAVATAGVTLGDEAAPEVKKLSLNQAIEMAMKDNHQVELAAIDVEKAELTLEQAEFARDKMINSSALPDKDRRDQNQAMVIDVVPVNAAAGKTIADTKKTYTENSIKFGVESAYYGLLQGERKLAVSQSALARAQEQLKVAQAKLKAGTVAKIEVIAAEAQLKSAEAEVNQSKADMEKARMALNKTLGLNLDTPIVLTDQFNFNPAGTIDPQKVFQEMQSKDLSLVSAQESYKMNEANWDYHQTYFTANTFVYRDAKFKVKEAEVNLNQEKAALEMNIKNAYLDLKTAEENYQVLTKSLEQAKEALRLTKLRYDVGMATGYDVLSSDGAIQQADLGLLSALYNYNLAKAKFTYGIFTGSSASGGI